MIAIFGGSGTLGRELVPRLAATGRPVRAIARHVPPTDPARSRPQVEWTAGDVRDVHMLDATLRGVDTVVSAIAGIGGPDALGSRAVDRDGNIALIEAARRAGVGTFVMLSIHQAGPDHPMKLFRDKWAAEEALRASGLSWTVIRPTAYLETWLGLIGGPLVETGTTRIFGTGRNPINFVSTADVATFVQLAIEDESLRGSAIEVPGPENLTLDDLAALVEAASGRTGRKDHAPRRDASAGPARHARTEARDERSDRRGARDGHPGHGRRRSAASRSLPDPDDDRGAGRREDVRRSPPGGRERRVGLDGGLVETGRSDAGAA